MPSNITPFDFGLEPTNFEDSVSVTYLISSGDLPIAIEWLFNNYGILLFPANVERDCALNGPAA